MCRLFGFRSNTPAAVHRSLVEERNSLRVQSREHKDGWGVAYYDQSYGLCVAHGLQPAHLDPEFDRVSRLLSSHAVVAHIRLGTVGPIHQRNTHPFLFKQWTFAHNGTIRNFERYQATVESWIAPEFRSHIQGDTDSERCFYVFLTELSKSATLENPNVDQVAAALARTSHRLCALTDPELEPGQKPTSTNFLATDGQLMVTLRRHRTLFFSEQRKKTHGPHEAPRNGSRLEQLVIASEELSGEDHWHEVPEDTLLGVDPDLRLYRWNLSDLLRATSS
jgi:predicted glutamine amidotransferase